MKPPSVKKTIQLSITKKKKKKRHTQGFWKEETRLFSPSAAGNGTPASLGADLSCLMQRLALPTVNSPGHAPSQAALLTERVVVKAPSTTGITLAPSPCQPRFSFFFGLEALQVFSSQHRGCSKFRQIAWLLTGGDDNVHCTVSTLDSSPRRNSSWSWGGQS